MICSAGLGPVRAIAGRLTSVSVSVRACSISVPLRMLRLVRNGSASSPLPRGEPSPGEGGLRRSSGSTISQPVQMGTALLLFLRRDIIVVERFQKLDDCSPFAGARRRALQRSKTMATRIRRSSAPRTLPRMAPRVVGEIPWEDPATAVGIADVEDVDEADDEGDEDVGREVDDGAEDEEESVVEVVGGGVIAEEVGVEGVAEVEAVEVVGGGVRPP